MDTDRTLLVGVLALQADLIDPKQFAEACAIWAASEDGPLADLLVRRAWLEPADREDVERLLRRKLKKHGGDARALAGAPPRPVHAGRRRGGDAAVTEKGPGWQRELLPGHVTTTASPWRVTPCDASAC